MHMFRRHGRDGRHQPVGDVVRLWLVAPKFFKKWVGVTSRICTGPSAFTELCAIYYTMATIDSMVPPTGAAPASSRLKSGAFLPLPRRKSKIGPPAWSCTRIFRLSDENSTVELRENRIEWRRLRGSNSHSHRVAITVFKTDKRASLANLRDPRIREIGCPTWVRSRNSGLNRHV